MSAILHIGPPKTATTSLQTSVIPQLGRPYQVKPEWVRSLTRDPTFEPPRSLRADMIVSDERIGRFGTFPPEIIADRFAHIFDNAVVIYIARDPVELFYSMYRQVLLNAVSLQGKTFAQRNTWRAPRAADEFFDLSRRNYLRNGSGFFSGINLNSLRVAFERYFDFAIIDFDLLKQDARAFVSAFARACDAKLATPLPHENQSDGSVMREALDGAPPEVPAFLRAKFEEFYNHSRLTPDREDFLRSYRYNRELQAFAASFRFEK